MAWEWGVTGEKVVFQNFGLPQSNQPKQQYAWHCITIDPKLKYKWSPRSCVERKHYVCEVSAGRIGKINAQIFIPGLSKKKKRCTSNFKFACHQKCYFQYNVQQKWKLALNSLLNCSTQFNSVGSIIEWLVSIIARRRKKTADPFAPQNQRLKPRKKGKKYTKEQRKQDRQAKQALKWRKNLAEQNADNYWVHGVNLGSRPPSK